MNLPIGTVISGRYEIIEKLGSGGMANVYRATDKKLERSVTVKVLRDEFITDEEFKARFKIEARSAASLSHPNIVNVYDVGEDGNIYYIVMEYVHGDTLKKAILEKAPFDSLTTISVAIQMASALSHAHKNHIVHRDIKPQNILVATDGTIKVTDFGIARAATAATVTTTANAIGSVHYFSPEQARGGYVDEKSDIYSLGISMFEMITGKLPYDGDTSVAIALKHLNNELPDIRSFNPNVSRSLEGIIKKATRKKVDERYATIDLLLADLKKSLADSSNAFTGAVASSQASTEKDSDGKEIEFFSGRKKKTIEDVIPEPVKEEQMAPTHKKGKQSYDLPESNVGFDKYSKKLKISKDDDYEEDGKIYHDWDDPDDDEEDPSERGKEKIVVVAAIITALIIIGVISVFGMKLFTGDKDKEKDNNIVSESIVAPSLEGLTFAQAQTKLENMGLTIEKTGEEDSTVYEEGVVISQSVEEGQPVGEDKKIGVVVSAGLESYQMPDVKGLEENEAVKKVKEAGSPGIQIDRQYENDDTVDVGKIISQQPANGTKINKDSKVILTISRGEELKDIIVPNVEGDTEATAKKKITSAGLVVGNITAAESTKVEKGHVITQTVTAGEEVVKNTTVGIVISSGPPQVEEPKQEPSQTETPTETPDKIPDKKPDDTQTKVPENSNTSDDSPIGSGVTAPANKSASFPVYAPSVAEGVESVHVKVLQIGEGGSEKVVLDQTKTISDFPFNISVSGSGQAEIQCYIDGNFQWSENVNFTEGGN